MNHTKVSRVVDCLRARGIDVWFDDTHMRGNIMSAMCNGIDSSDVILVFVTNNYIHKVECGEQSDNVRREFMYAADKYPGKLLAIRFEEALPAKWSGPVGMIIGSHMYTDMVTIDNRSIDGLLTAIRRETGTVMWKNGVRKALTVGSVVKHRTPPLPPPSKQATVQAALPASPPLAVRGSAAAAKFRERVALLLDVMGSSTRDGEHTGEALDRVLLSVVGTPVTPEIPFYEKLQMAEQQLGLL